MAGEVSEEVTPPVTSSPADQSDKAADEVGVAREEPETQLRRRPEQKPVSSANPPSPLTPASSPPMGVSLFLIGLLLFCIIVLVARRLVMFLIEPSLS